MDTLSLKTRTIRIMLIALMMNGILCNSVHAVEVIRIGGAGSGLGVMKILAEAFEKSHPGTKIKIMPNLGSSGGIKALLHGALDLAISGRSLREDELKGGAVGVECARTPFVFVVNSSVNKTDVTTRELEMIYKGLVPKWPDGSRIRLILRPVGDTDTAIVKNISKGMEQAVKTSNSRPDMIMAVTDQEAAENVAIIPGALGASTLAQFETEDQPVKVLSFNGIKPTVDALAKGKYPLAKPLYLVTAPKSPATALQFIKFARSAQGRAIIANSGTLPTAENKGTK